MTAADGPPRVSAVQRALETRLTNPLFGWLLRSPVHGLASRWLLVLDYRGRRSGERYTTPVAYADVDGALVVVTPVADSAWWRNFRTPYDCTVWHRGRARAVTGRVVSDDAERGALIDAYRDRHPLLARALDLSEAGGIAVVRFEP